QFVFFRRNAVPVSLSRAERAAIRNEAIADAVGSLEEAVRQGVAVRKRREDDFARALARWRAWRAGGVWLAAVEQLEAEALRLRQDVELLGAAWDRGWTDAVGRLRAYLGRLEAVLRVFDSLFTTRGVPDEVTARLTRAQREELETRSAEESAQWLRDNWPAPAERGEAAFALSD